MKITIIGEDMQITLHVPSDLGQQLQNLPNIDILATKALQEMLANQTWDSQIHPQKTTKEALDTLRELNPFRDIENPVEWQREIRKDRELPYR